MDITEDVNVEEEVASICENMCDENNEVKRYRPPPPLPFLGKDDEEENYDMPERFNAMARRSPQPSTSDGIYHNEMLTGPLRYRRHNASRRNRLDRGLRASHPYGPVSVGYNHNQQQYDGPSTSRAGAVAIIRPIPRKVTVEDITIALKNCKVASEKGASNAK